MMIVIATLLSVSWAGFQGLRTSMALHQSAEVLRSDIVYVQRSAMLLDRRAGENWVHGIGIDLSEYSDVTDGGQVYSLLKFCSNEVNYSDFSILLSPYLGNYRSDCLAEGLYPVDGKLQVPIQGGRRLRACTYDSGDPDHANYKNNFGFAFFEAVNGRLHLYNANGDEIPEGDVDGVTVTYFLGDKYTSITLSLTGEIINDGYDPAEDNPCL